MPSALVGPLYWLTFGTTTNATWSGDEIDVYRVVLQAGHTYTFSLSGASGGLDPALSLLSGDLTVVASNDDVSYPGNLNSSITYTATSSGEYYLGAYEVFSYTGDYSLTITDSSASDSIQSSTATSQSISIGGSSVNSTLDYAGDHDWVRVTLTEGQSYVFTMNGAGGGSLTDPFLSLRDSSGALVAFDDDGGAGTNAQLQFTATASGTYYLDAAAYAVETGGYSLSAATGAAQDPLDSLDLGFTINHQNITVYFAQEGESFTSAFSGSETATRSWAPTETAAAFAAFNTISAATNLTFTQVYSSASADFIVSLADLGDTALGIAYTNGGSQALIQFDPNAAGWTPSGLQAGGFGFVTLLHEFGHALGLDHPHYDGGDVQVMQGVLDAFAYYGTYGLDQGVFTTMGYNDGWPAGPNGLSPSYNYGWQSGLMALDVAVLQDKYGANATTNAGDTAYNLATSNNAGTRYQTIWDTGGTDTLAYAGSAAATIDLRAATLLSAPGGGGFVSYVDGIVGGYTIANGAVIENASGGSGNDRLIGNFASNILSGGGGADILTGGGGLDTLIGGDGNDIYFFDNAGVTVTENSGQGTDVIRTSLSTYDLSGAANVENLLYTGSVNFTGAGNALANAIKSAAGNDTLDGGAGADSMNGGLGDDTYVIDNVGDVVIEASGEGYDRVVSSIDYYLGDHVERLTLTGSANVSANGNAQANLLEGNAGNNILRTFGGADTLIGGDGNDTYVINETGGTITEALNEGTDAVLSTVSVTLGANVENLTLRGTAAINGTGNALANTITGNTASNILTGGGGLDLLNGGAGNDIYYFDNAGVTVTENVGEGTDVIRTALTTYDLSGAANVENLVYTGGSAFTGTGNALANVLKGGGGADTLDGGSGVDTLNGGLGDDVYYADTSGDVVMESAGGGSDRVYAPVDYYLSDHVERLTLTGSANVSANGNAQANLLEGNSGNNILRTFGGADTLIGGDGNDTYVINETGGTITENLNEGTDAVLSTVSVTLGANVENLTLRGSAEIKGIGNGLDNVILGNAGNNGLRGELGNDTLDGGAGNDVLKGGLGVDVLTGGSGADAFVFDTALGGGNLDTVTDFNVTDDTIWLSGSIFTSLSLGGLNANNFRIGAVAADDTDFIFYQYSTGALFYDDDGDGANAAIQIASLTPQLSLSAQDFVVI